MIPKISCYRCGKAHRNWYNFANCVYRRAEWISGEGQYALLAHCGVLTVTLWGSLKDAEKAKDNIDGSGCGHTCYKKHEIIDLEDKLTGKGKNGKKHREGNCQK